MSKFENPFTLHPEKDDIEKEPADGFILSRTNVIVMIVAAVMIVAGFALMAGAPSTETEFNPEIFSTRRIVVGPLFAFLGFVVMALGIIINPKKK